ncbi:MAG: MFS transporter, partial [Bdellovibrionota bacterium]
MRRILNWTVFVAALGYFVDMFDITIFGVVRVPSLQGIGITDPAEITRAGVLLVNLGAAGMLAGGLLWGILGDKRGRLSVLFGSIFLYSIANVLNAYVGSLQAYGLLRFLAGVGLAGELGAAVTLISETLSKND